VDETRTHHLPADAVTTPEASPPDVASGPDLAVPGYEILAELGRGGMGVVYKARQVKANRIVALKMIRSSRLASQEEKVRFQLEAEAVARFRHPNLVPLYEVGEHDGVPFFSLEFCEGGALDRHLKGASLPSADAAVLVEKLARAMDYAHSRGVVHRDLKPANVLLQSKSEPPSDFGFRISDFEPKVSDFGLAKQLDADEVRTHSGQVLGTPAYMAPEQAAGGTKFVGPAADVYALGAILYECLTGRPPFQGTDVWETLEQVRSQEPVAPRRLRPDVPRDIETVCLKCLHKDPLRRYPTAAALAEDLRRFWAGEPIEARPVRGAERLVMWARRRPTQAALAGLTALTLVLTALGAGAVWLWRQAEDQRRAATVQQEKTEEARKDLDTANAGLQAGFDREKALRGEVERHLYLYNVRLAHRELLAGAFDSAAALLTACPESSREWEWYYVRKRCPVPDRILGGHGNRILAVSFSPDGRRLMSVDESGTATLWDVTTGRQRNVWRNDRGGWTAAAFSPDGRRVAAAGAGPNGPGKSQALLRVWDCDTGAEVVSLSGDEGAFNAVAFSPNGRRLAAAGEGGTVRLWDAQTWKPLRGFGAFNIAYGMAFSPDGALLAVAGQKPGLQVWEVETGTARQQAFEAPDFLLDVVFAPGGDRLVGLDRWGAVWQWDLATGRGREVATGQQPFRRTLAFRPATGPRPATELAFGRGKSVVLLDLASGAERTVGAHDQAVIAVAFTPDGRWLATGGGDRTVRLWDAAAVARGEEPPVWSVDGVEGTPSLGADGQRLVLRQTHGLGNMSVRVRRHTGEVLTEMELGSSGLDGFDLSPDGRLFANVALGGKVSLYNVDGPRKARVLVPAADGRPPTHLAFMPDGRRLLGAGPDGATAWDLDTGRPGERLPGATFVPDDRLLIAPDGAAFARLGHDVVTVWSFPQGNQLHTLPGHGGRPLAAAFSPDGRWLAVSDVDRVVRLWDRTTGAAGPECRGAGSLQLRLAFHPGGTRLATGGEDGTIRLWDVATGQETLQIERPPDGEAGPAGNRPLGLWFASSGRRLLWVRQERLEWCEIAPDGREPPDPMSPPGKGWQRPPFTEGRHRLLALAYSADGAALITCAGDRVGRVWNATTGQRQRVFGASDRVVNAAAISPDGRLAALPRLTDQAIEVIDTATGGTRAVYRGHGGYVSSIAFSPDGTRVASGDNQTGELRVWEAATGKEFWAVLAHERAEKKGKVTALAWHPDGSTLATTGTATTKQEVKFWDAATGRRRDMLLSLPNQSIRALAYSPDGRLLVAGTMTGRVMAFDPANGAEVFSGSPHAAGLTALAFSRDGRFFATVGGKEAFVWDAHKGQVLRAFRDAADLLSCVGFAPDARRLAGGDYHGGVKVWNLPE
jgi:WD40 repeat protein/tRNA A-37 threonylcarbamoyl transferase component Bud32